MSNKTRKRLTKAARNGFHGLLDCIELLVSDHGPKRPRRSSRTITRIPRQTRTRIIRQVIYRDVDMRTGEVK